jgi:hypothetical protein
MVYSMSQQESEDSTRMRLALSRAGMFSQIVACSAITMHARLTHGLVVRRIFPFGVIVLR